MGNVMRFFSLVARKSMVFGMVLFAVCAATHAFAALVGDMISGAQMKQKIILVAASPTGLTVPILTQKNIWMS